MSKDVSDEKFLRRRLIEGKEFFAGDEKKVFPFQKSTEKNQTFKKFLAENEKLFDEVLRRPSVFGATRKV